MKHIIISIAVTMFALSANAQKKKVPEPDTTKLRIGTSTIIFIENDPNADSSAFDWEEEDDTSKWGGFFDIGINGFATPENSITLPAENSLMELDYSRSYTVGFSSVYQGINIVKDRLLIEPGFGIHWNHYAFENNVKISTSNDYTTFTADTVNSYDKLRMRATYLDLPLFIALRLGDIEKPVGVQFGVIGSYKIGSSLKMKYSVNDSKQKEKIKDDYNLSPFKLDALARVNFGEFGFFARYALTPMFENNKAPELYPFSVGVTIGDF